MKNRIIPVLAAAICLCAQALAFAHDDETNDEVAVSKNQIIKLTDHGLEPATIRMRIDDSIVFFYNDTKETLATLEVDFGDKKTHCSSSNMVLNEAGKIKSSVPFGPKEFASTCFHDRGEYPFTIYGVPGHPKGISSKISVE